MFLQKCRAKGALIILAGSAALLLFGCPEATEGPAPYVCENGTAAEGTTETSSETRCVSCNPGYRLDGNACAINAYTCENGVAKTGRPKDDGETRCVQCNPGFRLVGRTCFVNGYRCANGVAATGEPATHHERRCVSCDAGFRLENNLCAQNTYTCANGDPFHPPAPVNGTPKCIQCDVGYHLEGEACVANAHVCPNGVASSGRPDTDRTHMCSSCPDAAYSLYTDSAAGGLQICFRTGGYICANGEAEEGTGVSRGEQKCKDCDQGFRLRNERCVAHRYTCPNGVAARGIPAVDEEVRCVSCDPIYRLEGTQCVPKVLEDVTGIAAFGDIMYMVGDRFDRLYTVDTATTVAKAVDPTLAPGFGVGETGPAGLAFLDETLYMVGRHNNRLYTLDTATGAATAVGTAQDFGANEREPWGLVAIGKTLHMVGVHERRNGWFHVVDTATGAVVSTKRLTKGQDGVAACCLNITRGMTAIGDALYVVSNWHNRLWIVERATGVASSVPRAHEAPGMGHAFGINEQNPTGLTSIGETLYMGGYNSELYTLDRETGVATLVGIIEVLPKPAL